MDPAQQRQAQELFEREIQLVTSESFIDIDGRKSLVRQFMTTTGAPAPEDTWLGVVHDHQVIGAVHAAPEFRQAARLIQVLGRAGAAGPDWVRTYIEDVACLEEIAVMPAYQRQGVGTALVRAVLVELAARQAATVSGFTTTPACIELFRAEHFTIGGHREPIPPDIRSTGWDLAPDEGRYFWKALPRKGHALGRRAGQRTEQLERRAD